MDSAGKSSAKFHSQSLVVPVRLNRSFRRMFGGLTSLLLLFYSLGQSNVGGPKGNLFITGSKSENTAIIKQLLKYQQPLKSLI